MSTLVVDELFDGVTFSQKVRVNRNVTLVHIRPWIYKEGTLVDGDFTCEVYENGTLLASDSIAHTEINTAITDSYFHGYIRFDFNSLSLAVKEGETETEYELRFSMANHTTDQSNFIGITRNWDIQFIEVYGDVNSGAPNNSMIAPAGIELYEVRSL